MKIRSFDQANLKDKKIVLRVDYNVPLKNGKIADDTRIRESLSTIRKLLRQNCSIIIISHLGRPDGKPSKELSLQTVAKHLQKLLRKKVIFINNCVGPAVEGYSQKLKPKQIILLENLRFYDQEEKNDQKFAQKLAKLGDIYINDAFGCAHRAHASITGITEFLPSYAGLLLTKEVKALSPLLNNLEYPTTIVIGGAKIDSKIDLIKSFSARANYFIFGGGIANTFLAAKHYQLANSLLEKNKISTAKETENSIRRKGNNVLLPSDFRVSPQISSLVIPKKISGKKIPAGNMILDIGPTSAKKFSDIIKKSKTIIWNGPMGVYEYRPFRKGTKQIAKAIAMATKRGAQSFLGGGDTIDALKKSRISLKKFTHVSTGGGAMLEFLEKGTLPGLEVLKD